MQLPPILYDSTIDEMQLSSVSTGGNGNFLLRDRIKGYILGTEDPMDFDNRQC